MCNSVSPFLYVDGFFFCLFLLSNVWSLLMVLFTFIFVVIIAAFPHVSDTGLLHVVSPVIIPCLMTGCTDG